MPRKRKARPASANASRSGPVRLQRLLASAGFGSRRQCEELIETGRVHDADIVTKLGTTVDPEQQKVMVDGQLLKKQKLVYFAVHKPTGVVTTNRDPQGRPRVVDLVPPSERVFPVGRLDRSSEGLILLTNDGELAQRLTHPKYGVRKIYRVIVAGRVEPETMKKMRQGMYIAEGFVKVEGAKLINAKSKATEMEITLQEGKNREIRRILARLGHKVQKLRRIAVGPLRLGDVPPGAYRPLLREEVDKLWASVDAAEKAAAAESTKANKASPRSSGTRKAGSSGTRKAGPAKTSGRRPTSMRNANAKQSQRKKSGGRKKESPKADSLPFLPKRGGTISSGNTSGAVIGGDAPAPSKPKKKSKAGLKKTKPTSKKGARNFGKGNNKNAKYKKRGR
jgi:23S rRNA pseudouridine2605 synthase